MRQHFHRCPNLRLVTVAGRDLEGRRGRGQQVLDELCAERRLSPCVGLVECEVLDASQKRSLLAARVTRLREEEGTIRSALGDTPDRRGEELRALAGELREEHREIIEENRRLLAEATAAADWGGTQPARLTEGFASAGVSPRLDESLRTLRAARLDALERALESLAGDDRLACLRCKREIEVVRLRETPDTRVCADCARAAARPELEAAAP
jgi:RNA polymerase-binding transcription factor DksA